MTDCLLEDADLDTIFDDVMISNNDGFDMNEKTTNQKNQRKNRIAKPRQMGDWIVISVNGDNHTIKCNCKRCNRMGKCHWVACLEAIQFGLVLPAHCLTSDEGIGWSD